MAIRIKKRSQRDDDNPENESDDIAAVESADRVIEASRSSWSWLSENRNLAIAIVVVLVGGILVFTLLRERSQQRREATSSAVYEAYKVATVPVGAAAEDAPAEDPSFETLGEQLRELRNRSVEVAAQNEGQAVGLAQLLAASSRLAIGDDLSASLAGFRSYREQAETGIDRMVADVGIAAALAANDQLGEAMTVLDELQARYEYATSIIAPLRANLQDIYGEPADAIAAYEDAIALLDGAPGAGRLEGRLLELRIRSGAVENIPVAGDEEAPAAPAPEEQGEVAPPVEEAPAAPTPEEQGEANP